MLKVKNKVFNILRFFSLHKETFDSYSSSKKRTAEKKKIRTKFKNHSVPMYTYLIGQHNGAFSQRYRLQSKTYQKKKNREENMFVN